MHSCRDHNEWPEQEKAHETSQNQWNWKRCDSTLDSSYDRPGFAIPAFKQSFPHLSKRAQLGITVSALAQKFQANSEEQCISVTILRERL
jgi:hypothetical protein